MEIDYDELKQDLKEGLIAIIDKDNTITNIIRRLIYSKSSKQCVKRRQKQVVE